MKTRKQFLHRYPSMVITYLKSKQEMSYGLTGMGLMAMRDLRESLQSLQTGMQNSHCITKTEFKMFVNHSSAAEVGTSQARINRTGKTNASKGVENHYNEYSEFHARETEAHICASFMEMTGMNKITEKPDIPMPDTTLSKELRAHWLLEICKKHVKNYVFNTDELTSLVTQTTELEAAFNNGSRWECRAGNCERNYAYHSGRVRHEVEAHSLSFDNGSDIRDPFGYYFCRVHCGLVFKTKITRNRHEEQQHGQKLDADETPPRRE